MLHRKKGVLFRFILTLSTIWFLLFSINIQFFAFDIVRNNINDTPFDENAMILAQTSITVTNNAELSAASGGDNIFEDLFITETGPGGFGIQITGTTDPFIIRNSVVIGVDGGIYLGSVTNATIENVTSANNIGTGILLYQSWNVSISNSNCSYNFDGIKIVYETSNVTIWNSTMSYNSEFGLQIDSTSGNNSIQHCSFVENYYDAQDDEGIASTLFYDNFYSYYDGVDETPRDFIGDTPCEILGGHNEDTSPRMMPYDRHPITWIEPLLDIYVVEYGDRINYDIDAIVYGGLLEWTINNSMFSISSEGVIQEETWLPVDIYNLNVTVSNIYGNSSSYLLSLCVEDSILPVWSETPSDQYLEVGESYYYDLNATDLSIPLWYNISDSTNFTIDPSTGVITSNTPLTQVHVHVLNVTVRDCQLNSRSTLYALNVVDSTPPVWIETPIHQTLEYDTPFIYDINATDYSDLHTFGVNDTVHFAIDSNGIITNATYLDIGEYHLGVWVNDTYGNIQEQGIIVTILDLTSPIWIIPPSDQYVEFGDDLSVQFSAWDASGIGFWSVNDTTLFDASTSGVIISVNNLEIANYSLLVQCFDVYGNEISSEIVITVDDTSAPTWNVPLNDLLVEKGVGINYQLQATDPSGVSSWWIEGTTPFIVNSNGLITNSTSLDVGTYQIDIRVDDELGHILQGSFDVEVVDTKAPTWYLQEQEFNIQYPEILDIQLEADDHSDIIAYSVNDTIHFSVTDVGRLQSSGSLAPGVYLIEVTATDSYDNEASIVLTIIVNDTYSGFLIIAALVGFAAIFSIGLVVYLFDPKRGRFSSAKRGGSK